ncbi:MAG: recombinase family protein [Chloracidobacterium sp.]|nr:recombinase family protein [Chloracidobacterium sp.]
MINEFSLKGTGEKKRVGIWIRVSTELQVESESPEHHEKRGKYYAEAKGWDVVKVYSLDGVSGKSVIDHPETKRMMEDVRNGKISGLIFSKLARLARNTRELLDFSDFFRQHDADLISLGEAIDTSSPAGRLFYTIISAMGQWEREEISARVAASVPIRAKLGKPLGGAAPFGYRWENRELVPDSKEAPIRRLMYELFLAHQRKKTVADLLNKAGHRTRNGSKFTDTTVDRLLQDTTAKGIRRANYTRSLGEKKHWVRKPKSEWVETPIEPIIEVELWDQVNAILEQRQRTRKKPGRRAVQLFAGLAFCHCGQKMRVPSNSPKYVCPDCHNKISTIDLEEIFRLQLKNFLFSTDDLIAYFKAADDTIQEKQQLLESLKKEQDKVQMEMKKIYRLYMEDKISTDGFGHSYGPLEERLRQIASELPELQGEVDFMMIQHLSQDETISQFRSLYDRWLNLEKDEKRIIIEHSVERITVGTEDINIELGYMPSSSELMASKQRGNTDSLKRRV